MVTMFVMKWHIVVLATVMVAQSSARSSPRILRSQKTTDPCEGVRCGYYASCQNGECVCPAVCTPEYNPVCGSDGFTYANQCELEVWACLHQTDISALFAGDCNQCPDGSDPVNCIADPCAVATCELFPDATCEANYCGGCNAIYKDANGDIVDCDNICHLPPVSGTCEALIPRWFYNKETRKCEQFTYGGCGGNGNNFEGKSACNKTCVRSPKGRAAK